CGRAACRVWRLAGLRPGFEAGVPPEGGPGGTPAPDVSRGAPRRLGQPPGACAAVEDSANGIRSALAAGLHVVAIPNRDYPPPASVLAKAQLVIDSLAGLTTERV